MSVALSIHDHVATVTLNRPQAMNAVDLATEAELQRIWASHAAVLRQLQRCWQQ